MADDALKIDVDPVKRKKFKALLERKKITQKDAFNGLIDVALDLERLSDAGLSLFLGQIKNKRERHEILLMILRRQSEEK